jgi:hypothetical protein
MIYSRLEKRPSESPVDVVVVDPDIWQSIPIGRVQHVQMDLAAYVTKDRINQLLEEYETIAVIDDIFFRDDTKRDAIIEGEAWRALTSAADDRPDIFTWWIIRYSNYTSFKLDSLVRMSNNTITLPNGTQLPLPLAHSPVSRLGSGIFGTVWNEMRWSKIDFVTLEHPFRDLLSRLINKA